MALVWALGLLQERSTDTAGGPGGEHDLASWAGGAAALLAFLLPGSLWSSVTVSSPWLELGGLVVLLPATAAAIWSRLVLGSMWSSAARTQAQHTLRTGGPYAITRHPIYSAIIAMLVGTALTQGFGRWGLLLVAITLLLKAKIAVEEKLLTQQFPEQYARYQERVPQLIPHLLPAQGADHHRP